MKLKRYDIKKLLSDPATRRMMIARSTVVTQAREGIDITLEESLASYDAVLAEQGKPAPRVWSVRYRSGSGDGGYLVAKGLRKPEADEVAARHNARAKDRGWHGCAEVEQTII